MKSPAFLKQAKKSRVVTIGVQLSPSERTTRLEKAVRALESRRVLFESNVKKAKEGLSLEPSGVLAGPVKRFR